MSPVFYSNSTCDSFFIGFSEYTVHPSLKSTFAIKLCNPFMAETNSGAVPAGRCPNLYRFDDSWLRNRTSRRIAVKPERGLSKNRRIAQNSSVPRKRASRRNNHLWIPAFAEMTLNGGFETAPLHQSPDSQKKSLRASHLYQYSPTAAIHEQTMTSFAFAKFRRHSAILNFDAALVIPG